MRVGIVGLGYRLAYLARVFSAEQPDFSVVGYVDPDPEVDKDKSNHIGVIKYGNEPLERWGGCPGMSSPEWIAETLSWVDWPKELKDTAKAKATEKGGAK